MASTSSFRASSSSSSTPSIPPTSTYDVFLSFRGEDTRYNFTDHLYSAMGRRGIHTFRDDKLRRGEAIAPELLKAIEESRSSVIVFSENYAHSRWCLDELVKIMECKKDLGHAVIPIFYHVDPSHVRKQEGSFGVAFAGYEENWKDKVGRWRTALTEAGNLSGWHLRDGYEFDYIKEITNNIFCRLNCKRLDVGANLVGIDSRVKEVSLRLHMGSSDVRIVGIYGLGGIGKTTIAKVIYNKLSCEFEYMSFLENIRGISNTKGLTHLQNQLLGDILGKERGQNINIVDRGASMIEAILSSKRVFMVLDDVDNRNQLKALLRHRGWLGKESRVIITTRNKHLLIEQEVDDLYEVEGLNSEEACELFSWHAFKQNFPKSNFIKLSCHIVDYCQGLPLALEVLGSLLFNMTIREWESELHKLAKEPVAEIHNVLKSSYDGLGRTEKNILLDVACFFKGEERDFVLRIFGDCVISGIRHLKDKCLITLPNDCIGMHDLIQQMCWEIVRENFPEEPDKWSRLWDPHDIERALTTPEGIKRVETIDLDLSKLKRVRFNSNVFSKMTSLRLLKVHSNVDTDLGIYDGIKVEEEEVDLHCEEMIDSIMKTASKMQLDLDFKIPSYELRYLCWDGYPLDFLPSNFDGENLVELHLKCSNIKQLWQGNKDLKSLKVIDLSHSKKLVQMREFSSMPNLEILILQGCVSLIDIHPSVGDLKKLTTLNLGWCVKLKGLPSSISNLEALKCLNLNKCSSFDKFSEIQGILGNMRSLKILSLRYTAIRELPSSIDLESVEILDLSYCYEFEKFPEKQGNMKRLKELNLQGTAIKDLPDSIGDLESLEILDLADCSKFEKFPEKGGNMKRLEELILQGTAIKDLPDSIGDLESLENLYLSYCSKFKKFPEIKRSMKHLRGLYLAGTAIEELPSSIDNLSGLEYLGISECKSLRNLPANISRLKFLKKLQLGGCLNFWEGLISNQLCNLGKLNISQCKMVGQILELPSSLEEIDAHNCGSKEDLSSLLWHCHLNWLKSATEELKCWKLSVVIPKSSGIPEWIRYQNLGSEVTTKLPMNWYEDPDFPGFVVSCVFQPISTYDTSDLECELNLYGNGFEFKDKCRYSCCWCEDHGYFKELFDQVWVWWYPKIAIPKEHHHKLTHINASFKNSTFCRSRVNVIKCGINLIFAGNQHNHKPMLEHPQNSGDNRSALQDTNGNVHGANQDDEYYHIPLLDLLRNLSLGDNGSVVLEDTNGNRKRRRDDSLPDVVEEPHYKRLGAPNTDLLL
ncbi:hypothetical protein PVL29_003609 [Vitis rotundifolia]|uniref:ADP-ribosyl cyclase/cyclic ADP-ribose hydrolase n=1 Tax=Vitis rotundifolia TaxID=103349 RepID=A0AA39E5C4_VITRO|nr:hypothetical protein PVL29_003609 [Vitis rotundifolia]